MSLEAKLAADWPPADWKDVTVLLAVSGGGDSVALLRAMLAIQPAGAGRICVGHLNHQLRPDADADERFVVELCRKFGVPCEVGRVALEPAVRAKIGLEAAARKARYRFLEGAAGRLGARFVVTAHTTDDQAETILHRILRGTGVRGLAGIARVRRLGHATLLRPLLGVRRAEVRAYLDEIGQPYCSDPSNRDPQFTRNRIRRDLLPRLERQYNREVVESLLRLGTLAGEAQDVIDSLVEEQFDRWVVVEGSDAARLALDAVVGRPRHLTRELFVSLWRRMGWPLRAMGFAQWEALCDLATKDLPAKQVFPGGIAVEVSNGELRFRGPFATR